MKTVLILALTIASVLAADPKPNAKLTKSEHVAAAEKYTARAQEFAEKALKHERAAARLEQNLRGNAMAHKWPGLARGPMERERDRAMQARRAEAESRELVAFHTEMANKTGVEAEP